MSDETDENEYVNSVRNVRKRLTEILHEVDDMIESVQAEDPLYKKIFPVKKEYIKVLGMKSASLYDILNVFLPTWKGDGRIRKGGRFIRIGKEGKYMGLPIEEEVDVYILCNAMLKMLEYEL
jgi:hypothetical protein